MIKFKAKNKDNGEWMFGAPARAKLRGVESAKTEETKMLMVFPHFFTSECSTYDFLVTSCEVIPETISEFTGLCDRNGTEIYENDIVETKHGRLCKVVWFSSPSHCGWDLMPLESDNKMPDSNDLWKAENLKVIGNCFDNPELSHNSRKKSVGLGKERD